jgi:NAD/NADP transhydrogenase alpha subunit
MPHAEQQPATQAAFNVRLIGIENVHGLLAARSSQRYLNLLTAFIYAIKQSTERIVGLLNHAEESVMML